jgi:muramidase (phage lysozyme)
MARAPVPRRSNAATLRWRIGLAVAVTALMLVLLWWWRPVLLMPGTRPLVMTGGDPYIRALMRTISASEANVLRPYHVLHGQRYVWSLEQHPNQCESIGAGPNRGNCSTAAGRYQLLVGTWVELAARHHPERSEDPLDATRLSFAPIYQDQVVYAWLSERRWGDLSAQLRQGGLQSVLRRLSGTWTSLGYGIETNRLSSQLPRVYRAVLKDELARAARNGAQEARPGP